MIPEPEKIDVRYSQRLLLPIRLLLQRVSQPVLRMVEHCGFSQRSALLLPMSLIISTLMIIPAHAAAPVLKPLKGKGERCVEDTEFMRKNHMELLLHQRDETMHRGIRTKKHSLKECIACHAIDGDDGKPVSSSDPKHFCQQCHTYASVKIDCFECHASKPRASSGSARPSLTPYTPD